MSLNNLTTNMIFSSVTKQRPKPVTQPIFNFFPCLLKCKNLSMV